MFNILVAWELFSHSKIWRFWGAKSMATLGLEGYGVVAELMSHCAAV